MSDDVQDSVEAIKAMGITQDEDQIREALRRCNNNREEAVQLLFPESPPESDMFTSSGYRELHPPQYERGDSRDSRDSYNVDVDMQETEGQPVSGGESDRDSTTVSYTLDEDTLRDIDEDADYRGSEEQDQQDVELREFRTSRPEGPPPRYEDIVNDNQSLHDDDGEEDSTPSLPPPSSESEDKQNTPIPAEITNVDSELSASVEFPLTHYYELEGRVHTEQWSVPYKRDESLAICMVAAIKMIREGPGIAESDENCKKFLEKTMPDAFSKLITHEAVYRWDQSIMEGILDMCRILLELIAERLKQMPIPVYLLNLLTTVFNADVNYHQKMKNKRTDHSKWQRVLGEGNVFAVMPHFHTHKDPKGWLVEVMNIFAHQGGVQAIKETILNSEDLTIQELTALFQPFSVCEDYINPSSIKAEFSKCILKAIRYIHELTDDKLKDKEVGCVSDLLKAIKTLLVRCSLRELITAVDNLRLDFTIRMLNIAHFNAKMNALKEVVRLTEEPYQAAVRGVRSPIAADKIADWLVEKKVLSTALGGNLHQSQYCEKLRSIVEFLGPKLSMDELTTIWEMQVDKNPVQIENVHGILAAAASRSTSLHLDHLFQLIQQSWESASDRYREKLLELIGKIGRDDRQGKTASKILELLWRLAHLPQLSREMVELALESHSSILIDSYHAKETEKRTYITKCVEDIRKGTWVVSGLNQLHKFAKGFFRSGSGHKDQHQIADLQRQNDLLRLTCNSLIRCHTTIITKCKQSGETLSGDTLYDGRYTQRETVEVHLKFMAFLLQDGALYMPLKRANEVWDTLISNSNACQEDRRLAFKWFDHGMNDMEHETQVHMFNSRVLKVDPSKLDQAGYHCLRAFFESINLVERKLRKMSASYHSLIVENLDLTGIDYLWRAALEVRDTKIADELINNILQVSYQGLSIKLKKDVSVLHKHFIGECFHRLDDLMDVTGVSGPPKTSTGRIGDPELRSQAIERLLLLAQRYIIAVEENFHFPRVYPPHGSGFLGHPITLTISPDQPKTEFKLECHSNESILSVRKKIAKRLNVTSEQLQVGLSERWLDSTDNNKLIHQLGLTDHQLIIVKTHTLVSSSYSKAAESKEGNAERQALGLEQERCLPGVVMASSTTTFDKLEELCDIGNPRIIATVRSLLMLIPTDHRISETLEMFTSSTPGGASEDPQSPASPQTILDEYFNPSNTSPTKLLYNLEVLSSHLIPTAVRESDEDTTHTFRRVFLQNGGLKAVINVLQKNALPSDVDLIVRQDCYAIALSLARFLLCNQAVLAPASRVPFRQQSSITRTEEPTTGEEEPISVTVVSGEEAGSSSPVVGSSEERHKLAKVQSTEDEVARLTIETMSVDDFATTLAYLVRVCWSAAAGQLHLASIGDSEPSSPAQSLSERGKPSPSPAPPDGKITKLRAGLCAQQEAGSVTPKDVAIARESLELLVTCLKLRSPLLNIFYTLPHIEEFIIDILLGSPHPDIRASVVNQLSQLSQINTGSTHPSFSESTPSKRARTASVETPHSFFLQLLINHPESLWETTPIDKNIVQWERCSEYFNFRYQLLDRLKVFEQEALNLDISQMLEQEMKWLDDVTSATPIGPAFQCLLAGHLRLCLALFTCGGVDKKERGHDLALRLVSQFLFPASKMIHDTREPRPLGIVSINPICGDVFCRVAAYDLLVELANDCYDNLYDVAKLLILMHHQRDPQIAKEWEFQPPVVGRSACGFVGLKNAGATCYMNSVLQQLYMTTPVRDVILSAEREQQDDSILPELQSVFGHLQESKLQYYSPEDFWKTFKLWGQPVNVREQQDAFDFFCNLTDQVDEKLKKTSCIQIFKESFGGSFLDQKICRGCEHTYEQEESFMSLSLPVKSKKLEESLKEFVKGDWLEGDNAYFCEKCKEKRDTLKRTCIKTLPPVLVVHLKRFDYDWEANRAIKYDDFFEFPWLLDLEPYTAEGISQQEKGESCTKQQLYELVGIVVHSGQASAGHYYSFVKEKSRFSTMTSAIPEEEVVETSSGKWLRFNDILVDEFTMNDIAVEIECFGGYYSTKGSDTHSTHPETRTRYWNAYMLFYEAVDHPNQSTLPRRRSSDINPMSPLGGGVEVDKLSQLQALVQKGERRHMFSDTMPSEIQQSVNEENLQFMQHRDVYCKEYFEFMYQLATTNLNTAIDPHLKDSSQFGVVTMELAFSFLHHTFFKTRRKLRVDMDHWVRSVETLLNHCGDACVWMMELLAVQHGTYLRQFLLECTSKEVRQSFCRILSQGVQNYVSTGESTEDSPVTTVVDALLQMLEKDVIENSKACAEYFEFFKSYASYPQGCRHLLEKDTFVLFVDFLLGPSQKQTDTKRQQDNPPPRRWSPNQVKEFGPLHSTLSLLVRNTDISMFESESEHSEEPQFNPYMLPSHGNDLLPPSDGMHQALFTIEHSKRFIKECVLTLKESDVSATEAIASTFSYCCWNNQSFSACAIEDLQVQIGSVPSNELKSYFKVLTDILSISDSLQQKRVSFTISGGKYQPHVSIFATIQSNSSSQSDSKKAYQGIKFLVNLANKCKHAKDFLLSHPSDWQWAVTWLRRKLYPTSSDSYSHYSWSHSSSNETSGSRIFQRTVSAQDTLEEANALLNELEARDSQGLRSTVTTDKNQPEKYENDQHMDSTQHVGSERIEG